MFFRICFAFKLVGVLHIYNTYQFVHLSGHTSHVHTYTQFRNINSLIMPNLDSFHHFRLEDFVSYALWMSTAFVNRRRCTDKWGKNEEINQRYQLFRVIIRVYQQQQIISWTLFKPLHCASSDHLNFGLFWMQLHNWTNAINIQYIYTGIQVSPHTSFNSQTIREPKYDYCFMSKIYSKKSHFSLHWRIAIVRCRISQSEICLTFTLVSISLSMPIFIASWTLLSTNQNQ